MGYKKSIAIATGIGIARAGERIGSTSGFMHRELAHRSLELAPPLKIAARLSIWQTGVIPRVWAALHRTHHDKADQIGDPHSPKILGVYNVLFKNHIFYRRAASKITESDIPKDLAPSKWDKKLFDKKREGFIAGIVVDAALNKAAGNSIVWTPITTIVGGVGYVAAGNLVNTIGHLGEKPGEALLTGEITDHADGTDGSDSLVVAAITGGEGLQWYHHEFPESIGFMDAEEPLAKRIVFDPIGTTLTALTRTPLASVGKGGVDNRQN